MSPAAVLLAREPRRDTSFMSSANLDIVTTVIDTTCSGVVGRRRFVG
jgi:hypothetical protein